MAALFFAQDVLVRLAHSTAEKKQLFSKLAFYEEGEQTGRILAKIVNVHQVAPNIGALTSPDGKLINSTVFNLGVLLYKVALLAQVTKEASIYFLLLKENF